MSYADVFGGQGSPQWVTLATGVGGKSQTVPARSMSGYRFRNMSGCVVQLVVDGSLQDEFEPYSEGSGYLGYPGQSIQQVQYEVQEGDPVELSNYAVSSWRCLVELVPVDLPYQRVRMSATITGTVQLAAGTNVGVSGTVDVGNSPTVGLTGGTSVGVTGNVPVVNPSGGQIAVSRGTVRQTPDLAWTAPITNTGVGTMLPDKNTRAIAMLWPNFGESITMKIQGQATGAIYWSGTVQPATFIQFDVPFPNYENLVPVITDAGAGARTMAWSFVYDSLASIPYNYGNTPLLVAPGASASAIITAVTAGVAFTRSSLGGLIAKPPSVYAVAWGASASMVSGTAGTQGWGSIVFLGVKGATSGSELWLAACGLQIPAVNVGVAANEVAARGGVNVFPYPLAGASLLPNDTQVQPQLAYVALSGVVPTGALALLD